jgi:hypothetical protein
MSQHLAHHHRKPRSLIAAGDIVGAESALAELADTEGDGALMVVLDQLPPKDMLAVIREYDTSKESVVNLRHHARAIRPRRGHRKALQRPDPHAPARHDQLGHLP